MRSTWCIASTAVIAFAAALLFALASGCSGSQGSANYTSKETGRCGGAATSSADSSGRAFPGDQPDLPDRGTASLRCRWFQEGFHILTGLLMAVAMYFFWNSGAELRRCFAVCSMAQLYGSLML
jgi:hypothetical protein